MHIAKLMRDAVYTLLDSCAGADDHLVVVILGTRMRILESQAAMMGTVAPQEVVVEGTGAQTVKKQGTVLVTLQVLSGFGGLCVFAVCYRYALVRQSMYVLCPHGL